jgi:pyruvate formate lyase activating enzyme
MEKAPLIGIARHRLSVDGQGVTTLVAFHGCPLRCRYCINYSCQRSDGIWREMTTEALLNEVSIDNLYFLATGGGITFGGGEPCLRSRFIEEFCQKADSRWNITLETSLHVDIRHLRRLLPHVKAWIVDIKDMNAAIYRRYTSCDNTIVINHLRWLLSHDGMKDRVTVRLPLIPDYNTEDDVRRSREALEAIGVVHFDPFTYRKVEKR